jgi:hypothetical protein
MMAICIFSTGGESQCRCSISCLINMHKLILFFTIVLFGCSKQTTPSPLVDSGLTLFIITESPDSKELSMKISECYYYRERSQLVVHLDEKSATLLAGFTASNDHMKVELRINNQSLGVIELLGKIESGLISISLNEDTAAKLPAAVKHIDSHQRIRDLDNLLPNK